MKRGFQRDQEAHPTVPGERYLPSALPNAWECFVRLGPYSPGNAAVAAAYGPTQEEAEALAEVIACALNEERRTIVIENLEAHTSPAARSGTPPV